MLDKLPQDVLIRIHQNLDTPRDLVRQEAVCKSTLDALHYEAGQPRGAWAELCRKEMHRQTFLRIPQPMSFKELYKAICIEKEASNEMLCAASLPPRLNLHQLDYSGKYKHLFDLLLNQKSINNVLSKSSRAQALRNCEARSLINKKTNDLLAEFIPQLIPMANTACVCDGHKSGLATEKTRREGWEFGFASLGAHTIRRNKRHQDTRKLMMVNLPDTSSYYKLS